MDHKNVNLEGDIDKQIRDARRSEDLEDAFQKSPKEYNRLFDQFLEEDRKTRKQAGEETIADMLDELEKKRERTSRTR